jgi:hypothetical protein
MRPPLAAGAPLIGHCALFEPAWALRQLLSAESKDGINVFNDKIFNVKNPKCMTKHLDGFVEGRLSLGEQEAGADGGDYDDGE